MQTVKLLFCIIPYSHFIYSSLSSPYFSKVYNNRMLPLDTFLFDNVADAREHEEDNHFRLPYVPLLGCHMHPHNYFMIQIDTNTRYIGEYITMLPISRIPEWQLRQPPRDTLAECPHTGATSDFRALFKVFVSI